MLWRGCADVALVLRACKLLSASSGRAYLSLVNCSQKSSSFYMLMGLGTGLFRPSTWVGCCRGEGGRVGSFGVKSDRLQSAGAQPNFIPELTALAQVDFAKGWFQTSRVAWPGCRHTYQICSRIRQRAQIAHRESSMMVGRCRRPRS